MQHGHFLVRNRHQLNWYARVIVPLSVRHHFAGKRELRVSLKTTDKTRAKRLSRLFWVQCQQGFDRLSARKTTEKPFKQTRCFLSWCGIPHKQDVMKITTHDALGRKHVIDLDDPKEEARLAREFQANALALLEQFKDNPDILAKLMRVGGPEFTSPESQPETQATFHDAIALYIEKLETQGRRGKRLSPRTLLAYTDRLKFWQGYFGQRAVHTFTLKELAEIQSWLVFLPANFAKKRVSIDHAITMAKNKSNRFPAISDKTREEYLGQLKGLLEFTFSSGFMPRDLSGHVELPNSKLNPSISRKPFTAEDLEKIFPANYGQDFGARMTKDTYNNRFWFLLLAAFTGARLEELGQLQTEDIKTCPDTGIIYAMIDNEGITADGKKKRTKNLNSIRPIPIHSTLLAIGFMDYVQERQHDKKDKSLFKLKRDKQGRFAKGLSNWFSRYEPRKNGNTIKGYIERRGVTSKGTTNAGDRWSKSFHSFRHTVIDNLRGKQLQNGEFIREQDIALVVGHERDKKETASYGVDRTQLALRKAVIDAIDYETVKFENINWKTD
ncbi:MAG: site-specific integrase [Gammaproteobacteria bacterium]|nr:site-specific integrase [Pseudomonadales bacterium]